MKSKQGLLTVEETAKILGLLPDGVHRLSRQQLLEGHYPDGKRAGKYFLEEDVHNLHELRSQKDISARLPQMVMQALMASRRAERQVKEMHAYFGLDAGMLSLEKEEVVSLYFQAETFLKQRVVKEEEILHWARILMGLTEEYFTMVKQLLGEEEPWRLYYEVRQRLSEKCPPGTRLGIYVEHARRNLQYVTYFYIRGAYGERVAHRAIPKGGYARALIQTMFPAQ